MIDGGRYPAFNAAVIGPAVRELSKRSGVSTVVIEAILSGRYAAGLDERVALAAALRKPRAKLFALAPHLDAALDDREAQGLPRHSSTATQILDR